MNFLVLLACRGAVGGLLVVVFALVGEVVKPQRFAGVFGAAPSVALANLALVVAALGTPRAIAESRAMVFGGVAMSVACVLGVLTVRRWRAIRGTAALAAVWCIVAAICLAATA